MIVQNDQYFKQVEQLLAEGHEVRIAVKGHSMLPLLRSDRDTVELVAVQADDDHSARSTAGSVSVRALRVGDVVLFRYRGRHILHRIVARNGERFTLAGDGNYRLQEHCSSQDIIAIARRVIRPSGRSVACASRRWRWQSRLWLSLPAIMRRIWLGVRRRI